MKLLIIISLFLNTVMFAQTDKLERLKHLQQEGKLTYQYLGDDIYKLTYPDGNSAQMYFGSERKKDTDSIPTTTIDTWKVDTMLYHNMYSYWQELPTMTLSSYRLIIGDANKNSYAEIYAQTKDYNDPPGFQNMKIFEIDSSANFTSKFIYADSIGVLRGLYDIDRDGNLELLTRKRLWTNEYIFFKSDSSNGFPTTLDFVFSDYPYQKNSPTFGDFDKNGITDLLFYSDDEYRRTVICEYDSIINNFNTVFVFADTNGSDVGYVLGDFDMDGKTDIVFGSVRGEVNVIENDGEHSYKQVFKTATGGSNAYMMMPTNDIDYNGKPEFWISCTTDNGTTIVTRFTCFEYTGDNEYKEKYRIDFLGIFPIYAHNCFSLDVDKDGRDELVFCFDEHVFIIKYVQSIALPSFQILYMTRNSTPGGYWGASMYDLNNDDYEELLIHRDKTRSDGKFKYCTDTFNPDFLVHIENENHTSVLQYSLQQNYPNPFNPYTNIQYELPISTNIKISVFNILGQEISVLEEREKPAGKYSVQWNGKDKFQNQISSGIYFINLKTPSYNKTIKGVMLK